MSKLIVTDTYYGIFSALVEEVAKKEAAGEKSIVFCEEKVSLTAEREIVKRLKGTFNTDVYSFGKYLRKKFDRKKTLTKEGSAMVIRKVLPNVGLKRFGMTGDDFAPAFFELTAQLKSASVGVPELKTAASLTKGILSDKLEDICSIYSAYEEYVKANEYDDQSSILSYLPQIIENDEEIKTANVFIVGFVGFTAQTRDIVCALIKNAKSVTAILTEGKNRFAYVNETAEAFEKMCAAVGERAEKIRFQSTRGKESLAITEGIFNPEYVAAITTDKIRLTAEKNLWAEAIAVADNIRLLITERKCRYREIAVAVPDPSTYKNPLKKAFELLEVPYFIDEKILPTEHPVVRVLVDYADAYRKNCERNSLFSFIKNPLVTPDRKFADEFTDYVRECGINYGGIKRPFTVAPRRGDLQEYEEHRKKVVELFASFKPYDLLQKLDAEARLSDFSVKLKRLGRAVDAAVNDQAYEAVNGVLEQMRLILGDEPPAPAEFKKIFLSGTSALELSVIPQYNDAVFVGDYRQAALYENRYLFAVGLTDAVPAVKEDVALLSDSDISALSEIKVMVEPKIRVVNHRARENMAMALGSFGEGLFVSYPQIGVGGAQNRPSDAIVFIKETFTTKPFLKGDGYLTRKRAVRTFASDVGRFADGYDADMDAAATFYNADRSSADAVLGWAAKEFKVRLERNTRILTDGITSPTALEEYHKCPYRSFLTRGLRLKPKKEGKLDSLSIGTLMHDVFKNYIKGLSKVTDKTTSDALCDSAFDKVTSSDEYAVFFNSAENLFTMSDVKLECEKFCYKTFLCFCSGDFYTESADVEAEFKEGGRYDAISLLNGEVKISGKIDRVDVCKNYYRVIDYKTGSSDVSDEALFAGVKLQLYLYAAAVKNTLKDKVLAGVYYLPIADEFSKKGKKPTPMAVGKTLNDKEALLAQDGKFFDEGRSEFLPATVDEKSVIKQVADADVLAACVEYAVAISEKAASRMKEGVIVPSPTFDACKYCEFSDMCGVPEQLQRDVAKVDDEVIAAAVRRNDE